MADQSITQSTTPEQRSDRRRGRVIAGLCFNCGNKRPPELKRYCRPCADNCKKLSKALRDKRRAEGACIRCGNKQLSNNTRYCLNCIEGRRKYEATKKRSPKSKEYWRKYNREQRKRFSHYGLTKSEYESIVERQKGLCAICGRPPVNRRLSIDHCHATGKVRGLLCHNCNLGIGNFQDNTELLRKAVDYLRG